MHNDNQNPIEKVSDSSLKIDFNDTRKAALILRAINHKLRQNMLHFIAENEKMTVTDMYIKLRMEQSVASQHLSILRRAGLVSTQREGKYIYYKLSHDRIESIHTFTKCLLN